MERSARRADGEPSGSPPGTFSENEWKALRAVRPNVMIVGTDASIESAVSALVAELPGPVSYLEVNAAPPARDDNATLVILPQVAALSAGRQQEWLAWLSDAVGPRPQIVATNQEPVYPFVEKKMFLESLYYQLNTILVEAQTPEGAYRRYGE